MADNDERTEAQAQLPGTYIACPACGGEGELADGYGCEKCYCTGRIEIER